MATQPGDVQSVEAFGAPVVVAGFREAVILDRNGEARHMNCAEAAAEIRHARPPLLCHAPTVRRRLGANGFPALDILELICFVRPARFCIPTVAGVAHALDLPPPSGLADEARCLARAAAILLAELAEEADADAAAIARTMARAGWKWGAAVVAALGNVNGGRKPASVSGGFDVWRNLREWSEFAPEPQPGNIPVKPSDARRRLARLVGSHAEARPEQSDYASAACAAFAPREVVGEPNVVIAEAGTGVGKTLGYIAPASLWAEANDGAVWISTFTRNLQRQVDSELDRLYPDPKVKARRVVVRKGRENYLCLLNMQDAVGRDAQGSLEGGDTVALGLMARWAAFTRNGDMVGGDFPTWLSDLVGYRATMGLTDRRGECIYSACDHYHKCFVERTVRQARRADIVVANHALVMTQAALGGLDDGHVPTRLVFDEGHHVFGAADSAFSAELSGRQGADLRRWLVGAEDRRSRARGLKRRLGDVAAIDDATGEALGDVLAAARALPGAGWLQRIADGAPRGPAERFLAILRDQVYARAGGADTPYDLETGTAPLIDGVAQAAAKLETALAELARPMSALMARLAALMEEQAADMDTSLRQRLEAVVRGLQRRNQGEVEAWRGMLRDLAAETPAEFVDWFSVTREAGRDVDAGMHRHWIDPTVPFARTVVTPAHGVLITSATLRDGTGDMEADWQAAQARTGTRHLEKDADRAAVPSPFDYAGHTRVFVVTDVNRNNAAHVAAAYRELFIAAQGGGLGLFTAISRLRTIHGLIADPLDAAGLGLLAQHVDSMDISSLIDVFRAEPDTCLLGTDAVRDGIDVPGRALRLVVFDRVPWPRPSILHRARRKAFADTNYDDMITRLRLKQAYGRLVRRADDRGVFVMVDGRMPSRLAGAFPDGVEIVRTGLADAVEATRVFLKPGSG